MMTSSPRAVSDPGGGGGLAGGGPGPCPPVRGAATEDKRLGREAELAIDERCTLVAGEVDERVLVALEVVGSRAERDGPAELRVEARDGERAGWCGGRTVSRRDDEQGRDQRGEDAAAHGDPPVARSARAKWSDTPWRRSGSSAKRPRTITGSTQESRSHSRRP